jgi:hexosaminidase
VRFIIDQSRLAPALAEFGLYRHLPEATANPSSASFIDSVEVELSSNGKDAAIYYTIDGSDPGMKSYKYTKPLKLTQTTNLRLIAIRKDGTHGFVRKASFQKAKYGITLVNAPDEKYSGGGPRGLVDGATGTIDFADGFWSGFNGKNLEAVIDLGSAQELNKFEINFLESTKSWIFRPQQVEFLVSPDGVTYKTIFTKSFGMPEKENEQLFHVSFNQYFNARFIKVKATNFGKLPDWHPGKGEPAWLFVDEIVAE